MKLLMGQGQKKEGTNIQLSLVCPDNLTPLSKYNEVPESQAQLSGTQDPIEVQDQ